MTTTIEIRPEHRAKLLELAAVRGDKGVSEVIADALDSYLDRQTPPTAGLDELLALEGSLSDSEADELRAETRRIREYWR